MADRRIGKTRRSWAYVTGLLVSCVFGSLGLPGPASSQTPRNAPQRNPIASTMSQTDAAVAKITAPMTAIVDGVAFRDAISRLGQRAGVSIWLDRRVDPTATVQLGPLGPTAFDAIERLAESRGCVVHLIGAVVLVGPADWVDPTTAELLMAKPTETADVAWPDLTTPTEALAEAMGTQGGPSVKLPHDLWPATQWKKIDRLEASILVRSQFESVAPDTSKVPDTSKAPDTSKVSDTSKNSTPKNSDSTSQPILRRYRASDLGEVRRVVKQSDPAARIRGVDGAIEVRTTAAVHRTAAAAFLKSLAKPPSSDATFSVKTITSARSALVQFAGAANRKCVIEASASEACEAIITVEAKDVTLRELIDRVAAKAGVSATWTDTTVVISIDGSAAEISSD